MEFLSFFQTILAFLVSLLLAYIGDSLFRIPNGITLKFPMRNQAFRLSLQPWFNFQLPSFLGIISAGLLIKNYANFLIFHLNYDLVNIIRIISTITIIYKIGLGIDFKVLRKHKFSIFALSLIPNLIEALYVSFYSWKINGLLTKDFAFCLGFEVSGASTAILMPILLAFQQEKVNQLNGIPSILLAASVLDNIFSIFAFNFARTLALSPQNASFSLILFERLEGLVIGLILGLLMGFGLKCLNQKIKPEIIFIIGYFGGILSVFWLDIHGFRGAGFILVFISTLISTNNDERIEELSENFWEILRLFLFFFIGISIDFQQIDRNLLQNAIVLVFSSSTIRALLTILILYLFENLSRKEMIFGGISWIAKASLQAALGTSIFYESINKNYPEDIRIQALRISQISICYIVITGPLGAVFINKYGRKLLENPRISEKPGNCEENVKLIIR